MSEGIGERDISGHVADEGGLMTGRIGRSEGIGRRGTLVMRPTKEVS
jgi:hypothetical protein